MSILFHPALCEMAEVDDALLDGKGEVIIEFKDGDKFPITEIIEAEKAAASNRTRVAIVEAAVLRITALIVKRRMWSVGTPEEQAIYTEGLEKAADIIAEEEGIVEKLKRLIDDASPFNIGGMIHVRRDEIRP